MPRRRGRSMTVTGSVLVDLTTTPRDRWRHRVAGLRLAPSGCRAVIVIGALSVEPAAVRVLAEHAQRLHLDIRGESSAVPLWLDALRPGGLFPFGEAS